MKADQRLWRTESGDLVPDEHPDATVLAYAAGDEIPAGADRDKAKKAGDVAPAGDRDADLAEQVTKLRKELDDMTERAKKAETDRDELQRRLDKTTTTAADDDQAKDTSAGDRTSGDTSTGDDRTDGGTTKAAAKPADKSRRGSGNR